MNLTPKPTTRFLLYLLAALALIAADQLTKLAALAHFTTAPPLQILPFLRLTLTFNPGAAFGILADSGGWQSYFLSTLALAVSVLITIWLWRTQTKPDPRRTPAQHTLTSIALALILSGAIGNLIDRLTHQHVIDFILLHYQHWHFPVFNLADCAITTGAALLLYDALRDTLRTQPQNAVKSNPPKNPK